MVGHCRGGHARSPDGDRASARPSRPGPLRTACHGVSSSATPVTPLRPTCRTSRPGRRGARLLACTPSTLDATTSRLGAGADYRATPRTGRPMASSSIARRLSAVSAFYDYGIGVGVSVLAFSPVANVRRPKVSDDSTTVGLSADARRQAAPDQPARPAPTPAPGRRTTPGSGHRRRSTSRDRLASNGCPPDAAKLTPRQDPFPCSKRAFHRHDPAPGPKRGGGSGLGQALVKARLRST